MRFRQECELMKIAGEQVIIIKGEDSTDFVRVVMLNKSAALLWESLSGADFTPEVCAEILSLRYNIDFGRALKDVRNWLLTLNGANVIEAFNEGLEANNEGKVLENGISR